MIGVQKATIKRLLVVVFSQISVALFSTGKGARRFPARPVVKSRDVSQFANHYRCCFGELPSVLVSSVSQLNTTIETRGRTQSANLPPTTYSTGCHNR